LSDTFIRTQHNVHIIHRDIKAENVFFVSATCVKLGDFGFSAESEPGGYMKTYCCTPSYAAPELFRDKEYRVSQIVVGNNFDENVQGEYVDIWALGVLLYFMLVGQTPFRSDTVPKLKKLILAGNLLITDTITPCARHLIKAILVQLPTLRLSMKGISVSRVVPLSVVANHSIPPLLPNLLLISLQRHPWLKHVIVHVPTVAALPIVDWWSPVPDDRHMMVDDERAIYTAQVVNFTDKCVY
jgi:serine/threonine protein kinase